MLVACVTLLLQQPALALPESMAVRLFEAHPDLQSVGIAGPVEIAGPVARHLPAGLYLIRAQGGKVVITRDKKPVYDGAAVAVRGEDSHPLALKVAGKDRHYRGTVVFSSQRRSAEEARTHDALLAINTVRTRDYVESVVGSETQPGWPAEAVKAQAVLTETMLARHQSKEIVGDSTQREAYLGCDYVRPGLPEQVSSVWGEILSYQQRPAVVFYHSTCAGRTSSGQDVFGSAARGLPYLKSIKCDFCQQSPFWKKTVTHIPAREFGTVFGDSLPVMEIFDEAQRPLSVAFKLNGKLEHMSGYQFWILLGQKFGWDKAPGLRFILSSHGNYVVVTSTGAGHGVGLCQWGAAGQARRGKSYRQILQYYFPATEVKRTGGGG